jgi:hypothetical protein
MGRNYIILYFITILFVIADSNIGYFEDPFGRAVLGVGLRPLASWDCSFESH